MPIPHTTLQPPPPLPAKAIVSELLDAVLLRHLPPPQLAALLGEVR